MITINNKFEIGEKAFTVYRVPVDYKCPICEGNGKFEHNLYEVRCKNCNGTGLLHDTHNTLLGVAEVTVSGIKVSCNGENVSVKYRVHSDKNIRNRQESTMFKSLEVAELYCKSVNTKEIRAEY